MKYLMLVFLSVIIGTAQASPMKVVAIIDTGLDINDPRFMPFLCVAGHRDFTGTGLKDTNGHGTHIAGLIVKYAKKSNYCIKIYKAYVGDVELEKKGYKYEVAAIKEAIKQGAMIINISAGGPSQQYEELEMIKNHPEVLIVASAGNDGINLDLKQEQFYPASYKLPNIISVGMLTHRNKRDPRSNYAENIQWEVGENVLSTFPKWCDNTGCSTHKIMSGTSQAAAIHTGKLVKLLVK
jgi:thermitase